MKISTIRVTYVVIDSMSHDDEDKQLVLLIFFGILLTVSNDIVKKFQCHLDNIWRKRTKFWLLNT